MTTATGIQQDGRELARDNRGWVQALMTAGYTARGVIYVVMGILALQLALGRRQGETDRAGALAEIGSKPFGKTLLILMAIGFAAYGLWHLLEGGLNFEGEKTAQRLFHIARFVVYGVFAFSTMQFALNAKQSNGDEQSKDFTAQLMEKPAGAWLVGALGLVFLGMAAYSGRQAYGDRYKKHLKSWAVSGDRRKPVETVARVGLYARMVVFALIGIFFLQAAITHDADKAKGMDDALRGIADAPFGRVALAVVAAGLIAFGLYSFVEARYRKVMNH